MIGFAVFQIDLIENPPVAFDLDAATSDVHIRLVTQKLRKGGWVQKSKIRVESEVSLNEGR